MPGCHIALGGNVGNVEETFRAALAHLADDNRAAVTRVSSLYRTRPVGPRAGGEFTNAAAAIETSLGPLELLDLLKQVEQLAGRTSGEQWAPRPLDLDLIFYADRIIEYPRLTVPHPAAWYRRFVLDPLAEIAADVRHPVKGVSVGELRTRLLPRPLRLALTGSTASARERLRDELNLAAGELEVSEWHPEADAVGEPSILAWLGPEIVAEAAAEFLALPRVPRLDVSTASDPVAFLRGVVQAALG
jgi:2-amino-4-hydroxy-6-hydroxymethyldihydropteridine diphosphokinase